MLSNLLSGFIPLLKAELSKWFKTKKFLINLLLWVLIYNGFIFYVLNNQDTLSQSGMQFGVFDMAQLYSMPVGMFGVFGAIILVHNVISSEIENGISSWILSKPISRVSYLLSKFVANTLGIFLSMIPLQGFITYILLTGKGGMEISIEKFLVVVLLLFVHILFYISLTFFCNIFINSRIGVLAIPFGIFFVQQYVMNLLSNWANYFPYNLVINATVTLAGESVNYIPTLIFTLFLSVLLLILSVVRFEKLEL